MNLGGVRWYSSRENVVIANNDTNSLTKQNKESLVVSIFKDLIIFLENNPLNTDKKKKIESFILSQYNWLESVKPSYSVLDINMDIFTPKFNKFLMEKEILFFLILIK